jgi:hypothetical protein
MMLDFSETGDISTLVIGRFIGAAELGEKGREIIDADSTQAIATTDTVP